MMRASKIAMWVAVVLGTSLIAGCDLFSGTSNADVGEDVKTFIQSENLPDPQTPKLKFEDSEVQAFLVEFGPGCDCPSGCFYSAGWGLKLEDRIGWMRVDEAFCLQDSLQNEVTLFDVQSRDSTLFSTDFQERFKEAVEDEAPDGYGPIYEVFLQMLARDEDTPVYTLRSLTDLLFDQYLPKQAQALIENPTVRSNEFLLERLAELPDDSGYRPVKEEAEALLDDAQTS